MAVHDFRSQRLFLDHALSSGANITCEPEQASYLRQVLRAADGEKVLVFNGREGEWAATIRHHGKRDVRLEIGELVRAQTVGPDIHYLFAPLKRSRLDYMVQKATELGVARLMPVLTQRTVAERVNLERMRANVIEAAEQCGVLRVPEVAVPVTLTKALAAWDVERRLIFCDEGAEAGGPLQTLQKLLGGPLAVLIGPEGGFSADERQLLLSKPFVTALSLGPRIMRADTAAVAALALVNAALGDWT